MCVTTLDIVFVLLWVGQGDEARAYRAVSSPLVSRIRELLWPLLSRAG